MSSFTVHTVESAPEGARESMRNLQASVGFVPSLAAAMAESPELLNGFLTVRQIYRDGTFSPAEIETLSLTAAYENGCTWCMAFHTVMALKEGVSADNVEELRAGRAPLEPRLRALSDFARVMIRQRGNVGEEDLQRFLDAGYTRAQALEVVLGMAFSVMANYAGHLANAPLDPPFQPHAWQPAQAALAATA